MFALPPSALETGDLQPLSEAIDALCEILDGDREVVIEALAEIVRKRVEFEDRRLESDHRRAQRSTDGGP